MGQFERGAELTIRDIRDGELLYDKDGEPLDSCDLIKKNKSSATLFKKADKSQPVGWVTNRRQVFWDIHHTMDARRGSSFERPLLQRIIDVESEIGRLARKSSPKGNNDIRDDATQEMLTGICEVGREQWDEKGEIRLSREYLLKTLRDKARDFKRKEFFEGRFGSPNPGSRSDPDSYETFAWSEEAYKDYDFLSNKKSGIVWTYLMHNMVTKSDRTQDIWRAESFEDLGQHIIKIKEHDGEFQQARPDDFFSNGLRLFKAPDDERGLTKDDQETLNKLNELYTERDTTLITKRNLIDDKIRELRKTRLKILLKPKRGRSANEKQPTKSGKYKDLFRIFGH